MKKCHFDNVTLDKTIRKSVINQYGALFNFLLLLIHINRHHKNDTQSGVFSYVIKRIFPTLVRCSQKWKVGQFNTYLFII